MLLVTAILLADGRDPQAGNKIDTAVRAFRESLWPSEKTNREIIEQNKEMLDRAVQQEIVVRSREQ